MRGVAARQGPAAFAPSPDDGPTMWRYTGQRQLILELNFFATYQEDAYGMASAMQLALEMDAVKSALGSPDVAVWQIGDITDVSALLGTGYEGRAMFEVWLGVALDTLVDLGEIDQANIQGQIFDDLGLIETININATVGGA